MAGKDFNQATRILGVIDQQIKKGTRSGAGIDVTYGQVFGVQDGYASVYIAGSRELAALSGEVAIPSDYFRVPAFLSVAASDYVRVSIDSRGHRWIDEVLGLTKINALEIEVGGQISGASVAVTGAVTGSSATIGGAVNAEQYQLNGRNAWLPSRVEGFLIDNPAAGVGPLAMQRFSTVNTAAHVAQPIAGRAGRVVGLAWRKSAALTAGSIALLVTTGGTDTSVVTLTSSDGNSGSLVLGTPISFTATQALGVKYTTDASYAPVTIDYGVDIIVEYEWAS